MVTYDGVSQTVTKQIVDVFDDGTLAALQAIDDLRIEYFDGNISRTITYEAKDSNGVKHSITETEEVSGFENVNPYTAPKRVTIKNMSGSYNFHLTRTVPTTFEKTIFLVNPQDFGDSDTPIIGYLPY